MGYEGSVGAIENNLSRLQVRELTTLYGDYISGPHGGQHAGAGELETYFTCAASDLGYQLAACSASFGIGLHAWPA